MSNACFSPVVEAGPHYKQLFDALPGNTILVQTNAPEFTVVAATPAYLHASGHTKETLIGRGVFEAFPANSSDPDQGGDKRLLASFQQVVQHRQAEHMALQRYDLQNRDGSFTEKYWSVTNTPVFAPGGEVAYIIHTAEDITDVVAARKKDEAYRELEASYRKAAENQETLRRFKFMADNAQDPFILMRRDGSFAYLNQKALDAWGYSKEEAAAIRVPDVDPIYQDKAFAEVFARAQEGKTLQFETIHKRKDGQIYPVEVNMNGITLNGEPHMFAVARDITERKKAEEALRQSEERLQKVLLIETVGVIYFDLDGRIHDANPAFERMSGWSRAALATGMVRWDELTPPEFMEVTLRSRNEFKTKGQNTPYEKQYIRPDGSRWWGLFAGKRLSETECVEYVLDITRNKQVEAALREKDESLRNIIQQAPVAIFIFRGKEMIIDTANKKALEMMRRTEAVVGKPLLEAVPELKGAPAYNAFQEVFRTGVAQYGFEVLVPLEQAGVLENRYFNFAYTPLKEAGAIIGIMDVATEVTEQVLARQKVEAAKQEIEKQKRLYEAISNNTPDLQYIFDLNYQFIFANEALLAMWGQSKEEALGKGMRELGYEEWHAAMHEREIDQIVDTRQPLRGVVTFPHAELGRRVYDYLLVPVLNEKGEVEAVAGTTRDITEIKQAAALLEKKVAERTQALQSLNRELQRSNQNLEEFAHAASHDLKEPVRKIQFFTRHLKDQLGDNLTESQIQTFGRIESAAQRMGHLIDDLLLYSHVSLSPHKTENVDLSKTVLRVLDDLELSIQEKGASIQVQPLPVVQGYSRQLQQLLQNLISNSLKYSRPGVAPQIDVAAGIAEEEGRRYHLISIKDNGIGFEQEYAQKIFQMFARLHGKHEYSGTGVGLAIAKRVVDNHHGFIRAEGVPGKGAAFYVYLPVQETGGD